MARELEYYRERAQRERELADASTDPRVAAAHAEMADVYEALVANDKTPTARILTPDFQQRGAKARRSANVQKIEG